MSRDTESAENDLLKAAYRDFNSRHIDRVLAGLHPHVEWANGWEGGHVYGREAVRGYWTRQWEVLDPRVEPLEIRPLDDGSRRVKYTRLFATDRENCWLTWWFTTPIDLPMG